MEARVSGHFFAAVFRRHAPCSAHRAARPGPTVIIIILIILVIILCAFQAYSPQISGGAPQNY